MKIVDEKVVQFFKIKGKKRRRHGGLTCVCMKINIKLEKRGKMLQSNIPLINPNLKLSSPTTNF